MSEETSKKPEATDTEEPQVLQIDKPCAGDAGETGKSASDRLEAADVNRKEEADEDDWDDDDGWDDENKGDDFVPFSLTYGQRIIEKDMQHEIIVSYAIPDGLDLPSEPTSLCGSYSGDGKFFHLSEPILEIHPIVSDYMDGRFGGLMKHLARVDSFFWIVGNAEKGSFHVRGIHPAFRTPSSWLTYPTQEKIIVISDKTLQAIIRRLFGSSVEFIDISSENKEPFSSETQLKMLFDSCMSLYPENVTRWAAQTFNDIEAGYYSSDIKRHAVKALSYVLNVDWQAKGEPPRPLPEMQEMLNKRFFALHEVKQAILEAAAYIRRTGHAPQWGILLVGPPGTGKTALAKTAAEVLNRPFGQLDFSIGTSIEAMCGSSRIYNNAKPGQLYEQIFAARTGNMILLLNEIDKCAQNRHGDLTNVMLSLLDGHGYTDAYIECTVPTDGIFCIATANDITNIGAPLLSRFRVIELPPYSHEEKLNIFEKYIFPLACRRASLPQGELSLSAAACNMLVRDFAPTSGVRDLEQIAERLVESYLKEKETENRSGAVYQKSDICRIFGRSEKECLIITEFGEAIGVYQVNGESCLFKIQAAAQPGTGNFRAINIGNHLLPYCIGAYEAVKQSVHEDMSAYDVMIFAERKLPELDYNYIGLPVCAALYSALKEIMLSDAEIFAGGCDLFGNICLYRQKIRNAIRKIESVSEKTHILYTASGTMRLCDETHRGICVIEQSNIQQMFSLLDRRKKRKR